jgi:stage II sporulation protein D
VRRAAFLLLTGSALLRPRLAAAQSDADPATTAARQELRVLLGPGDASPAAAGTFTFEGRLYRGDFTRLDDGRVVSVVDLEQYLCSVVPAEMPPSWPPAALQAQSVCARTYVLQRSDPRRAYDLVPSEVDQVYRGMENESAAATAAIVATAGQVLRFNAAFARVAYSSCCGGRTEAASDAWGGLPISYLGGVVCTSCADSPNFRWSTSVTLDALASSFSPALAALGSLQDVNVAARDASGRARTFDLRATNGDLAVAGPAFRRAMGPRTLRSLLITRLARSADGQTFDIEGGGLGHGVGLCQWGARGMVRGDAALRDILGYYFPGTVVDDLNR